MDLDTLRTLRTPAGKRLLDQAMALAPSDATFLACAGKMGKRHPPELVRAALQTAIWRARAATKFRLAERMWFTRESLEQATSEAVAAHRAERFAGRVLDVGCGIGGDAIALAARCRLVCIDRDPLRLEMARLNLEAHGLVAGFLEGDALSLALPDFDAVFVDPARRVGGKRRLSVQEGEPALGDVLARFPGVPLCAKLAPGVPLDEIDRLGGEAEFVSLDGELKECALWLGWGARGRRAAALPSGERLRAETPARLPAEAPPGSWVIDPGPAVARAGLVGDLARRLDAWPLDAGTIYLSADAFVPTPLARGWRIRAAMPLHAGRLRAHLREGGIGRVDVLRRGVPVDPEELVRKLKLEGDGAATLVLCPVAGVPHALVCDPLPAR